MAKLKAKEHGRNHRDYGLMESLLSKSQRQKPSVNMSVEPQYAECIEPFTSNQSLIPRGEDQMSRMPETPILDQVEKGPSVNQSRANIITQAPKQTTIFVRSKTFTWFIRVI